MKALIDADILLYSFGAMTDDEGHPLGWPLVKSSLDAKIHSIAKEAGCDEYSLHLTGSRNWRVYAASILPYKGNRNQPKPFWHERVRSYLISTKNHKSIVYETYEADDGMAIEQRREMLRGAMPEENYTTCICSLDKDLEMVPGWHYKWAKKGQKAKPRFFITEEEGMTWFFKQLLMGDKGTDNIPGLYLVGPSSTIVKGLDKMETELEMYTKVQEQYEKRFGMYWQKFMEENAQLLWMMRDEEDDVRDMLDELEQRRQDAIKEDVLY